MHKGKKLERRETCLEAEELNIPWKSQRRCGAGHGICSPDSYLVTELDNGPNCRPHGDEMPMFGCIPDYCSPLHETLKNDCSVTFTERSTYSKSTLATSKHTITRHQGTGIKGKAEPQVKHQRISLHKALLPPDLSPISRQAVLCLQTELSNAHLRETHCRYQILLTLIFPLQIHLAVKDYSHEVSGMQTLCEFGI